MIRGHGGLWLLVCWAAMALLASIGSYAISATLTPVYRATASVSTSGQRVDPVLAKLFADYAAWPEPRGRRSTREGFLPASSPVRPAIELRTGRTLGIDPTTVRAAVTVTDSNDRRAFPRYAQDARTISFEATAATAWLAAQIANRYALEYAIYHRRLVNERAHAASAELSIRIAANRQFRAGPASRRYVRTLMRRRERIRIAAAYEVTRFRHTILARLPRSPTNPGPLRIGLLAGLLVVAAGCLIVVVRAGLQR